MTYTLFSISFYFMFSAEVYALGERIHVFDLDKPQQESAEVASEEAKAVPLPKQEVVEEKATKVELQLKKKIETNQSILTVTDLVDSCSMVEVCRRRGFEQVLELDGSKRTIRPDMRVLRNRILRIFPPGRVDIRPGFVEINRPTTKLNLLKLKKYLQARVRLPSEFNHCESAINQVTLPYSKKMFVDMESYRIMNESRLRIDRNRVISQNPIVLKLLVGDQRQERIDVRAEVEVKCPQYLTSNYIRKDHIVTEEDFYTRMISVRKLEKMQDVDSLVGMQAVRNIESGSKVTRRLFKQAIYVQNRKLSSLEVENEGFTVSLKVLPLRDGSMGQTIPVRVKRFKKDLYATVIGRNRLRMSVKQ